MSHHDIIVIGASAGGIEALRTVVSTLPKELNAAVFVVLHLPAGGTSVLPDILARCNTLPAAHPVDGQAIQAGRIYVAPPDHHLLIEPGRVRLGRGPRENRCRPAIDPLFRSAARYCDGRVIGVVLSGSLDDGTAGLAAIKSRGGITVVQDPADALYPGMPNSAIQQAAIDHVAPARDIAQLLVRLVEEPVIESTKPWPPLLQTEAEIASTPMPPHLNTDPPGVPSGYACPECGGSLFEIREAQFVRFRCRTGHAYSPDSLLAEQSQSIEAALYAALRILEENAALCRELADRARRRGAVGMIGIYEGRASQAESHAASIRKVLIHAEGVSNEDVSQTSRGNQME